MINMQQSCSNHSWTWATGQVIVVRPVLQCSGLIWPVSIQNNTEHSVSRDPREIDDRLRYTTLIYVYIMYIYMCIYFILGSCGTSSWELLRRGEWLAYSCFQATSSMPTGSAEMKVLPHCWKQPKSQTFTSRPSTRQRPKSRLAQQTNKQNRIIFSSGFE